MKKVFSLLVGINEYPEPISTLYGCINDVDRIEEYLKNNFGLEEGEFQPLNTPISDLPIKEKGNLSICRLVDSEATYQNISDAFLKFLRQAGPEDIVWFHYSGHGAEIYTAQEFYESIEPNGKDQTIVCYSENVHDEHLHLADKELAVLLYQVATEDVNGQPKESPHILVSMDCCHSGSGTRDFGEDARLRTRSAVASDFLTWEKAKAKGKSIRELPFYAGGYYQRQKDAGRALEIPAASHILLSACNSIQKAGDLPQGGVFTSGLLEALDGTGGQISYMDVFVRTRAATDKVRSEQTPQIETIANFNAYTRFLDGSPEGSPNLYEVKFVNQKNWIVKCGAIHGLPIHSSVPIELEIQSVGPSKEIVGRAKITSVGAQKSKLEFLDEASPDSSKTYKALIQHLPAPPEYVHLYGESGNGLELLKKSWDDTQNILYVEDEQGGENPSLAVKSENNAFHVFDLKQRKHVLSEAIAPESAGLVMDSLGKMVKWRRMIGLDNEKTDIRNYCHFELKLSGKEAIVPDTSASEIKLYGAEDSLHYIESVNGILTTMHPELIVNGANLPNGQEFYCYLLNLSGDYAIMANEPGVVYRQSEHESDKEIRMPLWKRDWGWGIKISENESTSYLKLIISTEELDYQQLLQGKVGGDRDIFMGWSPFQISDDWCTFTIRLNLVYLGISLSDSQEAKLAEGNIRIQPHPTLRGKVGISSSHYDEFSQDPTHKYSIFDRKGFRLANFAEPNSKFAKQILEIDVDKEVDLQAQPLNIKMKRELPAGKAFAPIGFDGTQFRLFGEILMGNEPADEELEMRIHTLPKPQLNKTEGDLVKNPFGGTPQHMSLFQACRLGFFRMDLKHWIGVGAEGKLPGKVSTLLRNANQIAFLDEGIAPDSQLMAESLRFALGEEVSDGSEDAQNIASIIKGKLDIVGFELNKESPPILLIHKQGGIGFILK